jgi:catechol 2,3-dioxygenase-like lactoylglutathione lyase family enzyme
MLISIVAVTITAPDLQAIESAYSQHLRYQVVERGEVSADLAELWKAPKVKGRKYLLMRPASGEPVYLRFVESPPVAGYAPLKTHGWNATEILVEDPDVLALELERSSFKIIGPPRPLTMNPKVRAMQVIGPANELLYLTRIPPGGSLFDLGSAKSWVDRAFIVVVGGPSMHAMQAFYRDTLGLPVTEASPAVVNVINDANALPADHRILLGIARLPKNFLVEIDEYPAVTKPRPQAPGELPSGMAIVSFSVESLGDRNIPWVVAPRVRPEAPYAGRQVGLARGAAGELIELVIGQSTSDK